ncbi:ATP-binding protein [Streptomyces sp. NPDC056580]|uniref:ATP-binding protein n=1 Tax=Streptomyces sp. NPDC056580 TaxID=3345872 RepID=UPI0036D0601D
MTTTAVRFSGTDVPSFSETWDCQPESAAKARRLITAALSKWGIEGLTEIGALVTSELVSNAITHSGCRRFRLRISRTDARTVLIIVSDTNRLVPRLREVRGDSEGGRGLLLVAEMSKDWGYDRKVWGKAVWALLEQPAHQEVS